MIRDMYPQLSLAAKIFLCVPMSTAIVEKNNEIATQQKESSNTSSSTLVIMIKHSKMT
jgi:hypothetical protein